MSIANTLYYSPLRIRIANFLHSDIFGFDLWNLVHFFSGFLIIKYLKHKEIKNRMWLLFSFLLFFELIELCIFTSGNRFFIPETLGNQVWDIIISMLGGWLAEIKS